jgi:hypothetical protein
MREVQVFDQNGVNRALNKLATQSSTANSYPDSYYPASKVVNGNLDDWSLTNYARGMCTMKRLIQR